MKASLNFLLEANISIQLKSDFGRIEHIVAQRSNEGHDQRVFGRLLGLNMVELLGDASGKFADLVDEVHVAPPLPQ
jgi:hypothetical protein